MSQEVEFLLGAFIVISLVIGVLVIVARFDE